MLGVEEISGDGGMWEQVGHHWKRVQQAQKNGWDHPFSDHIVVVAGKWHLIDVQGGLQGIHWCVFCGAQNEQSRKWLDHRRQF